MKKYPRVKIGDVVRIKKVFYIFRSWSAEAFNNIMKTLEWIEENIKDKGFRESRRKTMLDSATVNMQRGKQVGPSWVQKKFEKVSLRALLRAVRAAQKKAAKK